MFRTWSAWIWLYRNVKGNWLVQVRRFNSFQSLKTWPIQVFQGVFRNHPFGGYDVCTWSAFLSKCREYFALWQHRYELGNGSTLVVTFRSVVCRIDPQEKRQPDARIFKLTVASGQRFLGRSRVRRITYGGPLITKVKFWKGMWVCVEITRPLWNS